MLPRVKNNNNNNNNNSNLCSELCDGRNYEHLHRSHSIPAGTLGRNPDCFWELITLQRLQGRKACDMSKVSKFRLEKKYKTWMSLKSNILCVVCINIHCILNCFWPTLYCFRCARNPSLHAVWIIASFSTDSTGSWPLPFLPKHISFCCIFFILFLLLWLCAGRVLQ